MTVKKWNEKAGKLFEELVSSGNSRFCNLENGLVFTDKNGHAAYYLDGYNGLSVTENRFSSALKDIYTACMEDPCFKLVTKVSSGILSNGAKGKKLETDSGTCLFVQEKLLRAFPKNTLYYIAPTKSFVLAGLLENGRLYEIGIIASFRTSDFIKK